MKIGVWQLRRQKMKWRHMQGGIECAREINWEIWSSAVTRVSKSKKKPKIVSCRRASKISDVFRAPNRHLLKWSSEHSWRALFNMHSNTARSRTSEYLVMLTRSIEYHQTRGCTDFGKHFRTVAIRWVKHFSKRSSRLQGQKVFQRFSTMKFVQIIWFLQPFKMYVAKTLCMKVGKCAWSPSSWCGRKDQWQIIQNVSPELNN